MTLVDFIFESFRYILCSKYKAYLFTFQQTERRKLYLLSTWHCITVCPGEEWIKRKQEVTTEMENPRQIERKDEEGRQDICLGRNLRESITPFN